MLYYKTAEEINLIKESCQLVSETLFEVSKILQPGVSTLKLDRYAFEYINDNQAEPAFLNYNGFPNTLCISENDIVVHGIPSKRELQEGDIVSIDCGVKKNGFYGDSCFTFPVGEISTVKSEFLKRAKQSLYVGIGVAKKGNRIGDIGNAIQQFVKPYNYGIVKELTGHGIGKMLHEKPFIRNYGRAKTGVQIKTGMVFAIEPMICSGSRRVKTDDDGWTLRTKDGSIAAHYEHTVAITATGTEILSDFSKIEEHIKF